VDLIGEERGRLARAAGWLDASRAEAAGLVVLLVGALAVTLVLLWGALGRPSLAGAPDASGAPGAPTDGVGVAAIGEDPTTADATDPDAVDDRVEAQFEGEVEGHVEGHTEAHGASGPSASAATTEVTVHVAGAVVGPGVVTLPGGARVADAIAQVGGLTADADPTRVNLARPLVDGEQILVLREGEEPPPPLAGSANGDPAVGSTGAGGEASGGGAAAAGGQVDINTAGSTDLETLPGIGPALAARIISHREAHGPFREPGDLRDVSGIGEKRFQDLAPLVTVG
jgi:competence protein ComEA